MRNSTSSSAVPSQSSVDRSPGQFWPYSRRRGSTTYGSRRSASSIVAASAPRPARNGAAASSPARRRTLPRTRRFVDRDELLGRGGGDDLADRVQRQVVGRAEADAGLAHVELLPRRLERLLEAARLLALAVHAHQVDGAVVLLRAERGVHQRLLVVRLRVALQR